MYDTAGGLPLLLDEGNRTYVYGAGGLGSMGTVTAAGVTRYGSAIRGLVWLGLGALAAGAWWRARCPMARFVVADHSMAPTLLPGDRLLILDRRLGRPPRLGDLVVVRDPWRRVDFLVKRVAHPVDGPLVLLGDNAATSRDSRHFGAVPSHHLVGRVVWRYAPAARRGSVPGLPH